MTVTRATIAKGAGAVSVRRLSDDRVMFLNTNSKYTFNKSTTEGDKVQGFTSAGVLVDLDVAGSEDSYELEITSKKNTRNINELVLGSAYTSKTSYNAPWTETATPSAGSVTLKGGTPVGGTLVASYLDGNKLTSTASAPSAAGQYKDNADGTVTLHTGDNGKIIVFVYQTAVTNVFTQGGADDDALGYLSVFFHQVTGTSSVSGKKSVDILWLPKCSISGDATFEFSEAVQDKAFKLTGLIPDTPAGFLKPYVFIRDIEIDNTNAG